MPAMRSQSIVVFTPGEDVPKAALFRTHFISIYQEEIKKFMQQKKDASRKHAGHTGS
jgi:hypothetical protein